MITNVTTSAIVVMSLLLVGFQSSVFAQSSSDSINSRIEEAEERINQSLNENQDIEYPSDIDIKWILFFTDLFAID